MDRLFFTDLKGELKLKTLACNSDKQLFSIGFIFCQGANLDKKLSLLRLNKHKLATCANKKGSRFGAI